jgi:hypothetical protein
MSETFEKLALFFDKIKSITFWDRVLPWKWGPIKALSYEAYGEYRNLAESSGKNSFELETGRTSIAKLRQENEQIKIGNARSDKELEQLRTKIDIEKAIVKELQNTVSVQSEIIRQGEKNLFTKQNELTRLQERIEILTQQVSQYKEEIGGLKESESNLAKQYESKSATLDRTQRRIEEERTQEKEQKHQAEIKRIEILKKNWQFHQQRVKDIMKQICQKNNVEYVDIVPFKGSPDNTIKICDEYIIFDAKAPTKDDTSEFYGYVRKQAGELQKYAKHEKVKKEMFLVIPSDTVHEIENFSLNMADYNVYIITAEALEPIILSLKKIEEYEFVDQLTPDDRDNICRIIGKFAHTAKRRIQIDNFFSLQFIEILTKCERDIPSDMREKVIALDRADKLNPPQDRRTKDLQITELVKETGIIQRESQAKGIIFKESISDEIKSLPLNQEDEPQKDATEGN